MENTAKPNLSTALAKELHELSSFTTYFRIFTFIALYIASAYLIFLLLLNISTPWSYVASIPLYIIAAASLHGISLFTHEGVHSVLSRNRVWNHILSALCAMPVLQNFASYRVLHLKHHRHLGMEGDPDHYKNYTSWSWLVFSMHWGRLLLGYPAYITAIPILGLKHGTWLDRLFVMIELAFLVLFVYLAYSYVPAWLLIHGWLIPMLIINTMVNIRGMSQHTLLEHETDTVKGTRTILTNPITKFFMCNENYHLEHHLYPNVPWHHLPKLHSELKEELVKQQAPFIGSYFAFVKDFVIASIKRSPAGTVIFERKK